MNKIEESYYGGSEVGRILNEVPVLPDYRIFSVDELLKICTQKEVKEVLQIYKKVFKDSNVIDNSFFVIKTKQIENDINSLYYKVFNKMKQLTGINDISNNNFVDAEDLGLYISQRLQQAKGFVYDSDNPGQFQLIVLGPRISNLDASHEFNHIIQNMKNQIIESFFLTKYKKIDIYDLIFDGTFMREAELLKDKSGEIMGDDGSLFMEYAEYYYNNKKENENDFDNELVKTKILDRYVLTKNVLDRYYRSDLIKHYRYMYQTHENEAYIKNGAFQFINFFAINVMKMNARDFRVKLVDVIENDVNVLKNGQFPKKITLETIIERNFYIQNTKFSRTIIFKYPKQIFTNINFKNIKNETMFECIVQIFLSCIKGMQWKQIKQYIIDGQ